MRLRALVLMVSLLSLSGCEKGFDEKYQDNLEQLNEAASEIEAGVNQQLSEGREADKVVEAAEQGEHPVEDDADAAK